MIICKENLVFLSRGIKAVQLLLLTYINFFLSLFLSLLTSILCPLNWFRIL